MIQVGDGRRGENAVMLVLPPLPMVKQTQGLASLKSLDYLLCLQELCSMKAQLKVYLYGRQNSLRNRNHNCRKNRPSFTTLKSTHGSVIAPARFSWLLGCIHSTPSFGNPPFMLLLLQQLLIVSKNGAKNWARVCLIHEFILFVSLVCMPRFHVLYLWTQ